MKDQEVIVYQARKIVELEIKVVRGLECERQLLGILRNAGIKVTEVELNQQEAEFLRLYRNGTPEGKTTIRAKVEAMAEKARMSKIADKENLVHDEPGRDPVRRKLKKLSTAKVESKAMELSGLPKDFFKPSAD
jgi:hypothetical protein